MLPGTAEHKDVAEHEEPLGTSPPLELRRPASGPRVPHSLQSPQDRATGMQNRDHSRPLNVLTKKFFLTDSPQVAQVWQIGTRIPHPHYPDARFYDPARHQIQQATAVSDPPPAHRSVVGPAASSATPYAPPNMPLSSGALPSHLHPKILEREQREREKERTTSIPGEYHSQSHSSHRVANGFFPSTGHASIPHHGSLVPAMAAPKGRNMQVSTPPHGSQVPPQADSLLSLLQRYPVMWQGLLALKTDQAAVQMHFVFGNPQVASGSLPCNSDGSTPPLRIAQRMRLEQTQLEGVARKMQVSLSTSFPWDCSDNSHCISISDRQRALHAVGPAMRS